MKKKPKIRIIKESMSSSDSYTFLNKEIPPTMSSDIHTVNLKLDETTEVEKLDKLHKKKKVLTNEDMAKSSKVF